jgi:hypothetical protein
MIAGRKEDNISIGDLVPARFGMLDTARRRPQRLSSAWPKPIAAERPQRAESCRRRVAVVVDNVIAAP